MVNNHFKIDPLEHIIGRTAERKMKQEKKKEEEEERSSSK